MNFDDFFNAKPVVQEQQIAQVTEFRPNPKKGQNGVYQAVVRFLPNPNDPANKSIISKYIVYLQDKSTNTSMVVDCPSTVGQPDIIQNTFFALRNSNNAILQENASHFSRKQKFASLVQVLDCKSDPSLNGKILVWNYGTKVNEKLAAEMNPPMGEGHNPFNLISGRPFNVQVKEVGGFPNYDACSFFDLDIRQSGMRVVNPANGQVSVVTDETISTPQGRELVFNYLKDNAPSTDKYEYHEWTAEVQAFVNRCIQLYSDPNKSIEAMSAAQNPGMTQIQPSPIVSQAAAQPTTNFNMPQQRMGSEMQMPNMGLTANQAAPVTPSGFTAPELGSEVDALINGEKEKKAAPSMGMSLEDVLSGTMF